MNKKPNQPPKSTPLKPAGPSQPRPVPAPSRPTLAKRVPSVAPRPMVTALQRKELREQRRSAPPAPAQPVQAPAGANEALQAEMGRFNTLQGRIMLTQINDDVEDVEGAINALPANLENIRARGYVFKSYLERKVETLANQWRDLRPRVEAAIPPQARSLQSAATSVQQALHRGQSASLALSALESKVDAATRNLEGMYDTLDNNVNQTQQQLDDIAWTLEQAEQASYGFLPTEAPVEAVPANWKKEGDKDGVDGVLMLTDQRLIFEQKEEVATKKLLFVTTEKQKLQSLQWEAPVAQIEKSVGSKRGFLGKDDYLTITCAEGACLRGPDGEPLRTADGLARPLGTAELHLKGESGETWQGFIGRIRSGEIAKERTVPVAEEALETVANAPTKCPTCGATITQTILRGQTEMTCEYCGSIIRL